MPADCQPQGNDLLIRIRGHFDFSLRPQLQAAAAAEVTGRVRLDLGAVTYLDACALTLIRQLADRLNARGLGLAIHNASGDSLRLLRAADLQGLITD